VRCCDVEYREFLDACTRDRGQARSAPYGLIYRSTTNGWAREATLLFLLSDEIKVASSQHSGRKPKLTPESQQLFLDAFRVTGNHRMAAKSIGVAIATVMSWKAKGEKQTSGIYREFLDACTRAIAERITSSADIHYRAAHGEIYRAPKRKWIATAQGKWIQTNEIEVDDDGAPIMVDCVQDIDLRAIEWELARLDPETYAVKRSRVTVKVCQQTNVGAKPLLVEVLERLGEIPGSSTPVAIERRRQHTIEVAARSVE
jgi:hypothetical protein